MVCGGGWLGGRGRLIARSARDQAAQEQPLPQMVGHGSTRENEEGKREEQVGEGWIQPALSSFRAPRASAHP